MAGSRKMPYADAIAAIEVSKQWGGGRAISWVPQGGKGFPHSHKCRVTLLINSVIQEGYFLDLYHKKSAIQGVPDKISFSLMVNGARVFALDENGPSDHMNAIGRGLAYFQKKPDHPHVHFPVAEGTEGYAEPIERSPIETLWQAFLERANIKSAPKFTYPTLPNAGQMNLL